MGTGGGLHYKRTASGEHFPWWTSSGLPPESGNFNQYFCNDQAACGYPQPPCGADGDCEDELWHRIAVRPASVAPPLALDAAIPPAEVVKILADVGPSLSCPASRVLAGCSWGVVGAGIDEAQGAAELSDTACTVYGDTTPSMQISCLDSSVVEAATTVVAPPSPPGEDEASTADCPAGYVVVGCAGRAPDDQDKTWPVDGEGAPVTHATGNNVLRSASPTKCVSRGITARVAMATARCIKPAASASVYALTAPYGVQVGGVGGYQGVHLDQYGTKSNWVACDPGDHIVDCNCHSFWKKCESATMDAATGNCTVTFTNSAYPSTANAVCLHAA